MDFVVIFVFDSGVMYLVEVAAGPSRPIPGRDYERDFAGVHVGEVPEQ